MLLGVEEGGLSSVPLIPLSLPCAAMLAKHEDDTVIRVIITSIGHKEASFLSLLSSLVFYEFRSLTTHVYCCLFVCLLLFVYLLWCAGAVQQDHYSHDVHQA